MWHMPVQSCKSCVPGHPGMELCACQLGFPPAPGKVCPVCMGTKMNHCGECEQWWADYRAAAAHGRRPSVDDVINARAKTVHLHRGRPRQEAPYQHRIPAWTGSPIPLGEEPRRFHPMFLEALAEDAAALRRGSRVFQCVVTMDRLGRGREFWHRARRILDRGYLDRQAQYASYKAHMEALGLAWDAEASNWTPRR